jgi:dihydroxyacetone kinase-like protein
VTRHQFVNDPDSLVEEALAGFERAHPRIVRWNRDPSFVIRADGDRSAKVAIVSGGGSGHEPLHAGFVGRGMLDAAVPGGIFASPTAAQIEAATVAADRGQGVLHIVKNYTGDLLNFGIAAELVDMREIPVGRVIVDDDLATDAGAGEGPGRRGTALVVAVEKICGAAAEQGASLADITALGARIVRNGRTMAVALHACTHPGESRPSFDLGRDEIELGVGIHGERGIERLPFAPARELAARIVEPIVDALSLERADEVIVIVNGLGATQPMELAVIFGEAAALLDARGISLQRSLVGSYVTSLDMAGCSVTLLRADDELLRLWDEPVRTPALTW